MPLAITVSPPPLASVEGEWEAQVRYLPLR